VRAAMGTVGPNLLDHEGLADWRMVGVMAHRAP
jgi:hypothetical protein